jgi:hypothetical protein
MPDIPSVTCLMLTKDRPEMARHAVECFRRQTYPARKRRLLIWDQGYECDFDDLTDEAAGVDHVLAKQFRTIEEADAAMENFQARYGHLAGTYLASGSVRLVGPFATRAKALDADISTARSVQR